MTSSVIYYSTDARKNEIYLLNKHTLQYPESLQDRLHVVLQKEKPFLRFAMLHAICLYGLLRDLPEKHQSLCNIYL